LRAIEKATGRNLLFLFDQYVFRGGHPDYKVSYSWDGDSKLAKVTITQTQAKASDNGSRNELFDLKLPIAFGYVGSEGRGERREEAEARSQKSEAKSQKSGVRSQESQAVLSQPSGDAFSEHSSPLTPHFQTLTVRVHEREQTFYFPLSEKPQFISFDQGNHFLKTVSLEYPIAELKAQLQHDPDPISRISAAEALAKKGGLEAVTALSEALKRDRFWGVRAEIAKQLAEVKLDQAFAGLVVGLNDAEARVRRAVVEALASIKTSESYKALKPLVQEGDPSYYVEAAAARAIGGIAASNLHEKPKDDKVLKLLKTVLEERAGWNEVVRAGAIAGLSQMKTSGAALNLILEYTAPGVPQALRLSAIRSLGTISSGQTNVNLERILERLSELSRETFFLTQVAVAAALGQMETPKAIPILQALADQTPDGRVRRIAEEAVQRVQKHAGSDKAVKQLREELDQLKKENQDLKSRLEALEAKAK
ncbi:MAG TPA: HEAT repeat domain-containing protein, partial [Candidatus Obscuribacterales bacterium]